MPYTQCLEREVEADCKNEFCFRPFTLETKELIESYTKPWQMDCSDLSFANLFIWGTEGKMQFAEKNNVTKGWTISRKRLPINAGRFHGEVFAINTAVFNMVLICFSISFFSFSPSSAIV